MWIQAHEGITENINLKLSVKEIRLECNQSGAQISHWKLKDETRIID